MRPGVVPIEVHTLAKTVLHRKEHPVVVLCATVRKNAHSANFAGVRRIDETQHTARVRIGDGRARSTCGDFEVRDLSIKEATAAGVAHAGNEYGHVEWGRGLKVDDLTSDVACRHQRTGNHFSLQTQIPRLSVRGREIGITRHVLARWNKENILVYVKRERVPTRNSAPWIVQTSLRCKQTRQRTPRGL